jgi:hypothetical protein
MGRFTEFPVDDPRSTRRPHLCHPPQQQQAFLALDGDRGPITISGMAELDPP